MFSKESQPDLAFVCGRWWTGMGQRCQVAGLGNQVSGEAIQLVGKLKLREGFGKIIIFEYLKT